MIMQPQAQPGMVPQNVMAQRFGQLGQPPMGQPPMQPQPYPMPMQPVGGLPPMQPSGPMTANGNGVPQAPAPMQPGVPNGNGVMQPGQPAPVNIMRNRMGM